MLAFVPPQRKVPIIKIKIHIDITCGEGGFEEVEQTFVMDFVPPIGMTIQFEMPPSNRYRDTYEKFVNQNSNAGAITVEALHYQQSYREKGQFTIATGSQHYLTKDDFEDAIGQWVAWYGFETT